MESGGPTAEGELASVAAAEIDPSAGFLVQHAVTALRSSLESLLEHVEALQLHRYPASPVIPHVLEEIRWSIRRAVKRLESSDVSELFIGQSGPDTVRGTSQLRAIQQRASALQSLHQFVLRLGRMAHEQRPPWLGEVLGSIISRHLPERSFGLLFEPQPAAIEYVYEEVRPDLDHWLAQFALGDESALARSRKLPNDILILGYPAAEPQNVLLHPIFLHEVGHYVTKSLVREIVDHPGGALPAFDDEEDDSFIQECLEIEFRWLWEVASDLFAARIAGPAYFFGLAHAFNLSCSLTDFGSAHPPAGLRLRVLRDLLDGVEGEPDSRCWVGLGGQLRDWLAEISDMIDVELDDLPAVLRDQEDRGSGYPYVRLYDRLVARVPAIRDAVVACTAEHAYRLDARSLDARSALVGQLLSDIPANEYRVVKDGVVGDPCLSELADILNAGYEVLYNCDGDLLRRFVDADEGAIGDSAVLQAARARTRKVLIKSFELNHIQREFARLRGGLEDER